MTTQEQSTTVEARGPSGGEFARRTVVFLFGIVQGLILLRIVFLVLDAREANGLVSGILNVSQVFVGPFDGILHTNALTAGGSILDIAAIVAIVGWTVLELIVIAGIGIFRREQA
jgi:YGGT family